MRGETLPASFYVALVSTVPTVDTNTLGELTEIPTGNGYTAGGIAIASNTTDFPALIEDDALNLASLKIKELIWTATGGSLPSSGVARFAVLTDNNATAASRDVWAAFSLGGDRVATVGQTLKLVDSQLRLKQP